MVIDLSGLREFEPVSVHLGTCFCYDRSRESITIRVKPGAVSMDTLAGDILCLGPESAIKLTGSNGTSEIYKGYNILSSLSLRQVTPVEEPNIIEPEFLIELVLVCETEDEMRVRELLAFIEDNGLNPPTKEI